MISLHVYDRSWSLDRKKDSMGKIIWNYLLGYFLQKSVESRCLYKYMSFVTM